MESILIKVAVLVNLFNFQFLKRWVVKNKGRRWNAKTVVNILLLVLVDRVLCFSSDG